MAKKTSFSLSLLILANVVPLGGAVFFGWSLFSVLFFYWLETVVVGILNVPKMIMAKGTDKKFEQALTQIRESRRAMAVSVVSLIIIPFFIFHFGMFVFIHAVFLFLLYGPSDVAVANVGIALVTFFISHGFSFVSNFIGNKEYCTRSINQQMGQPYKRVVILHLAILFGAFPLMLFETSLLAVSILIVAKTAIDVIVHMREHKTTHMP